MKPPFQEFEPKGENNAAERVDDSIIPPALVDEDEANQSSRLRDIPFRMLVPNLITLGAICSGLTGIRLAFEDRWQLAIIAVVFAAILDGLDGRVARFLKASTSFGEQLDSLADFVNFGVAPALILYMWSLHDLRSFGWIVALVFAICGCLRLARFNVMLEADDKEDWEADFFTGVPAPAGAILALLPVYMGLLDLERGPWLTALSAAYMLFVGYLMVSNIPTWSGKRAGQRISRSYVLPVMLGLLVLVVVLFSFPWTVLTTVCLLYLAAIPFSVLDYQKRKAAN